MARVQKRKVENYTHPEEKRVNNPPVGLVTPETDRDAGKKTYAYDPHLDPSLTFDQQSARQTIADVFARTRATAVAARAAFDRLRKQEEAEAKKKPPDTAKLEQLKTEAAEAMQAASEAACVGGEGRAYLI
jgi:hypothetical protein